MNTNNDDKEGGKVKETGREKERERDRDREKEIYR